MADEKASTEGETPGLVPNRDPIDFGDKHPFGNPVGGFGPTVVPMLPGGGLRPAMPEPKW